MTGAALLCAPPAAPPAPGAPVRVASKKFTESVVLEALLALTVEWSLGLTERALVPRGLRSAGARAGRREPR